VGQVPLRGGSSKLREKAENVRTNPIASRGREKRKLSKAKKKKAGSCEAQISVGAVTIATGQDRRAYLTRMTLKKNSTTVGSQIQTRLPAGGKLRRR